jgi:5-methyltetrahydrofolate--homocysteine methyltransferase
MSEILRRFEEGRLLFDGGMGSMLIAAGLESGQPPEEWNAARPDAVKGVHRAYLRAGAEVVETNTFGGTPGRLAVHGLAEKAGALNADGVRLAREAIAELDAAHRFVAFSMGPCGEMLPPMGAADEATVHAQFADQLQAVAGTDTPDLIIIETMLDLREALIALDATRSMVDVPVAVSMTYNRNPRGFFTIMGDAALVATKKLEAAGADVIAANCSIASDDMLELARTMRDATTLPVLCQPNAGQPGMRGGVPVYAQAPEQFAEHALLLLESGINAVGGCCGTTPEFIGRVAAALGRTSD